MQLWLETLDEIGPERFDAALAVVMRESDFRPDIAKIRLAAGVNRGIVDPTEVEALAELGRILAAMRVHTPKLKAMPGRVIRERDVDGRRLAADDVEREPERAAPALSPRVEAALLAVGMGDRQAGLDALAEHPALYNYWLQRGEELPALGWQERNRREIEARWCKAYAAARA